MDHNALSYIHGKDGLAKESSGVYPNIHIGNDLNALIPSDLLPPNHPLHIKGTVGPTIRILETPESAGGQRSDEPDIEDNDLEVGVGGDNGTPSVVKVSDNAKIDAEDFATPNIGDNKLKVPPGVDKKGEQKQKPGTPTKVSHVDNAISTSNAPTKKWKLQPFHAVLMTLVIGIVVAAAVVVPVVLSSRNSAPKTTFPTAAHTNAPTSSPTSAPTSARTFAPTSAFTSEPALSPEQIACNFIGQTNLNVCRSTLGTLGVDSSSIAAGATIPSEIGLLTQMTSLTISGMQLRGTIPSSISNLSRLTYVALFNNQLTGTIPPLSNLSHLEYLGLFINQLSGSIPSLSNLSQLTFLYLQNNQLTGTIPPLSNLSQLQGLGLYSNQLTGTIPSSLSYLSQLPDLLLWGNLFTGTIPNLSNLSQLTQLVLASNQLTGTVPSSLSYLTHLTHLDLGGNQLSGTVPSSLCSLGMVIYIDCGEITCDPGCCKNFSGHDGSCG